MESVSIKGTKREKLGTKFANQLRKEGMVPCEIYSSEGNIHFYADARVFNPIIYTPKTYIVNIEVDGKEYKTIVKEMQFHPVKDNVIHIDFMELQEDRPVKTTVPVELTGVSEGVKAGGKLRLNMRRLKIKALPKHLPDSIKVAIDDLQIGQSIKVGDLQIENVELLDAKNAVIVAVKMSRKALSQAAAAAESE
ncbi:MAG: 50S ribosomal protein L25/general stress protein Ctc [Bacteroidetes bacterium]|nr:MAG: 50S ribosomal protein L25/general stress protein Ctc [Bacteroidota bacterium]